PKTSASHGSSLRDGNGLVAVRRINPSRSRSMYWFKVAMPDDNRAIPIIAFENTIQFMFERDARQNPAAAVSTIRKVMRGLVSSRYADMRSRKVSGSTSATAAGFKSIANSFIIEQSKPLGSTLLQVHTPARRLARFGRFAASIRSSLQKPVRHRQRGRR